MKLFVVAMLCGGLLQAAVSCSAVDWKSVAGSWNASGSAASLTEVSENWSIVTARGVRGDLTIEGSLDWQPSGKTARVGLVFGYINAENYAACVLEKSQYKAWNGPQEEDLYTISYFQVTGGKETLCNVCPLQNPKPGKRHLRVVVADTQFVAYLDGKAAIQGSLFGQLFNGTVGLCARFVPASFTSVRISQTPFGTRFYGMGKVAHDAGGRVLPRWAYKDMVTKPCDFVFWAADNAVGNWLRDEEGRKWPPYVYACTINLNGTVGTPTNYIPQEFSFYNTGFLDYYMFTGDKRGLQRAEQLAEWLMFPAHVIPADWKGGGLSITKVNLGKVVGDVDGKSIFFWPYGTVGEVEDKDLGGNLVSLEEQGAVGTTVLRLYHLTGKDMYLTYCTNVADALLRLQLADGHWDYRVNPRDGKPNDDFSANVLDNIAFLDEMSATTGKKDYSAAARRAEQWLVEVPCKSYRWLNIFGDVPSNVNLEWCKYQGPDKENMSGYVPMNAIRLLLSRRDRHPEYVKLSEQLRDWIYEHFGAKDCNGERGIAEQSVCYIVMPYHGFHLSLSECDLYEATGKKQYREMVYHYLNAGQYYMEHNGFILLMGGGTVQATGDMWWCNNMWAPTAYVYAMGTFPEMAPRGENHLVRVSSPLTSISYSSKGVEYGTARASSDRLVVASEPRSVTCNGKALRRVAKLGKAYGWSYAPNGLLRVSHAGGKVVVTVGR